jgi:hypothetical protein
MVIEGMMSQGIGSQASIGKALNPDPITTTAINRSSILVQGITSKPYCGKAINPVYWSLSNYRLELTAGSGIRSSQFVFLAAARRSSA